MLGFWVVRIVRINCKKLLSEAQLGVWYLMKLTIVSADFAKSNHFFVCSLNFWTHVWQTQAKFCFSAGICWSNWVGIVSWVHQQLYGSLSFAMAQWLGLPQRGQMPAEFCISIGCSPFVGCSHSIGLLKNFTTIIIPFMRARRNGLVDLDMKFMGKS